MALSRSAASTLPTTANCSLTAWPSAGSDWQQWKVRDIETGKDLTDDVQWVKFSGASWKKDGSGFFYSRYDAPASADQLKKANYFHKLYFHKLGTPQSKDELVYERKDHKDWNFSGEVTEDGRLLIINVSQGTDPKNRIFYKDLQKPELKGRRAAQQTGRLL